MVRYGRAGQRCSRPIRADRRGGLGAARGADEGPGRNALNDAASGGPTARLARGAIDRLTTDAAQEFREVGAADRGAVEERVKQALSTGEKPVLVLPPCSARGSSASR